MYPFNTYSVKVEPDTENYWAWCITNLKIGTWNKMIPFVGESATYHFQFDEDRTAFVLTFGLHNNEKNTDELLRI